MSSSHDLPNLQDIVKSFNASSFLIDRVRNIPLEDEKVTDFDLPNIVLYYSLTFPHDTLRGCYKQVQHNVAIWQAWEAASTETEVQKKIQSHELPNDDSLDAKLKRISYRAKVIQYLRQHATWLQPNSDAAHETKSEVPKAQLSAEIFKALSNRLSSPFGEVNIILRPISRNILQVQGKDQEYMFTFIVHEFDIVGQKYLTSVRTLFVNMKITNGSDDDHVQFSFGYSEQVSGFLHDQWSQEEYKIGKPIIEAGKAILRKKTVHLTPAPEI